MLMHPIHQTFCFSMRRPVQDDLVNSEQSPEPEEEVSPKFSPSSPVAAKVSRRAIITKNTKDTSKVEFTTEDQWFSKEKLYKVVSSFMFKSSGKVFHL